MTDDIRNMAGVLDVTATRDGDVFNVFVVMENMEFAPFSEVIRKELDLYEKFPQYTFNFDLMPAAALDAESTAPAPYAA